MKSGFYWVDELIVTEPFKVIGVRHGFKENSIEYTEENPAYRKAADKWLKKKYRDDICDIFP